MPKKKVERVFNKDSFKNEPLLAAEREFVPYPTMSLFAKYPLVDLVLGINIEGY
jgi:hypothetical protein